MGNSAIQAAGGLLGLLEPEMLSAAVLLYDEPLYQFANGKQEIHVLFVGPDPMEEALCEWKLMNSIFQLALSCGQVLNHTLHLHVAAKNAEAYKAWLLQAAPVLEQFTSIDGNCTCEAPLAYLSFESVKGINSPAGNRQLFAHLEDCSCVVALLHDKNAVLVESLFKKLRGGSRKSMIVYAGEKYHPAHPDGQVKLYHLEERTIRAGRTVERLGEMAFRQHYDYCRQGNPNVSMADERAHFAGSPFAQLANLSSVVHIRYKLWSVSINPKAQAKTILKRYQKILAPGAPGFDQLSYLEHSRWMMEKLLAGYRPMRSAEELRLYCFVDGNNKWRSDRLGFHNCLVPRKLRAESDLAALPHDQWDLRGDDVVERIGQLPYDELDRMSLLVHNLAWEKMQSGKERLAGAIDAFEKKAMLQPGAEQLQSPLPRFRQWVEMVVHNVELHAANQRMEEIRAYCRRILLPEEFLQPIQSQLDALIALAREFHRYKDYKAMDDDVVRMLPELYCRPDCVALVKLPSAYIVDQIASTLLIEPDRVIYAGLDRAQVENLQLFLKNRGGFAEVRSICVPEERPLPPEEQAEDVRSIALPVPRESLIRKLKQTIRAESEGGLCVVDVSGADAGLVLALSEYVRSLNNTALIQCDNRRQQVQDLYRYPLAACVTRRVRLSVEEVFSLMGARKKSKSGEYDGLLLKDRIDGMWNFYMEHAPHFQTICEMVRHASEQTVQRQRGHAFFYLDANPNANQQAVQWEQVRQGGSLQSMRDLGIDQMLRDLVEFGVVEELEIVENALANHVDLSYRIIREVNGYISKYLTPDARRDIFKPMVCVRTGKMNNDGKELYSLRWKSEEDNRLYVNCEYNYNEENLLISKNNQGQKLSLPKHLWKNALSDLQRAGMIYGLNYFDSPAKRRITFSFFFSSDAIRRMFKTTGCFLEMKVWSDIVNLNYFDDVKSNFQFWWDQEHTTENELDVLMTKGMEIMIISCKMPRPLKANLYEVYCLANRFSMNSQAAMVYAFDSSINKEENGGEDWHVVWARARNMNVEVANMQDARYGLSAMVKRMMNRVGR